MKTAVSLPDPLFLEAQRLAKRMGVSRSGLYAEAIREFVSRHRDDLVTMRLNTVYGPGGLDSRLDKGMAAIQYRSLAKGDR
jgi:hypothetical protein